MNEKNAFLIIKLQKNIYEIKEFFIPYKIKHKKSRIKKILSFGLHLCCK